MNKKIWFLLLGMLVSLAILSLVPAMLSGRGSQSITGTPRESPLPTPKLATSDLSAVTAKSVVREGEIVTIDIMITTGENDVTGLQLEAVFDPKLFAVDEITAGDFLQNAIEYKKIIDAQKGTIFYAIGSFEEPRRGDGVIARVKGRALKKSNGPAEIFTILPATIVTDIDSTQSVLRSEKGASLVIQ